MIGLKSLRLIIIFTNIGQMWNNTNAIYLSLSDGRAENTVGLKWKIYEASESRG